MRDKGYENTLFCVCVIHLQPLNQGLIPVRIYKEVESPRTTATAVGGRDSPTVSYLEKSSA